MTLVLQALGSNQTLDAGSLGVRLLALTLGLDLATDNVLADLYVGKKNSIISLQLFYSDSTRTARRESLQIQGRRKRKCQRLKHIHRLPC